MNNRMPPDKCGICRYNTNDYVCHPHCSGCDGQSKFAPKTLKFYKTIAVDFDGTLCENSFPEIGEPKPLVIEYIKRQASAGAHIILYTCRENGTKRNLLDEALQFCAEQGIELYAVNENPDNTFPEEYGSDFGGRKVYADIYIDDKAANVSDLEATMSKVLQGEQEANIAQRMDRLTVKSEIVGGYILKCMCGFGRDGVLDDEDACCDICNGNCDECGIKHAFDKLAAYENTELTPEEIKSLKADVRDFKKLIDRDTAKRVDEEDCCPICNTYGKDDDGAEGEFCPNCGQRLDWSDDNPELLEGNNE